MDSSSKKGSMSSTGQKCSSYKNRGYLQRDSSPRGWGPRRGTPAAARARGEGIRGNLPGQTRLTGSFEGIVVVKIEYVFDGPKVLKLQKSQCVGLKIS